MNHASLIANHRPTAATYANAAARTSATGFPRGEGGAIVAFDSSDVGKFARQSDDHSIWTLTAITPTWQQVDRSGLTSANISDFNEAVEDRIGLRVVPGTGISVNYNDGTGETTVTNTAPDSGSPPTTEEIQDVVGAMLTDNDDLDWTYNDGAGTETATVKGTAPALSPAVDTLTDGATITWATAGKRNNNAQVTLGGNRTLDITGEVDGATGTLVVTQDGTGSRTLTLPGSSKVINGGAGAVTLSTGAGKIDILTWIYLGTTFYWTIGKDYS